jgi:hypothetical protein
MRRAVGEFATVQVIGATRVRGLAAAGPVLPWRHWLATAAGVLGSIHGLRRGRPTDDAIAGMLCPLDGDFQDTLDPDQTYARLLLLPRRSCSPDTTPLMSHAWSARSREHGFLGHVTLDGIMPKLLEAVVSISFDRSRPADIEESSRM